MNFRKTILVLTCILPTFSFATERKIDVKDNEWHADIRSMLSIPMLSHDGNILYIYSDVPLENLQIQVKDVSGNVVCEDDVSITAGQKYSFFMNIILEGEYTIELVCCKNFLYGYLTLP